MGGCEGVRDGRCGRRGVRVHAVRAEEVGHDFDNYCGHVVKQCTYTWYYCIPRPVNELSV